jgi:hypothetical protein
MKNVKENEILNYDNAFKIKIAERTLKFRIVFISELTNIPYEEK